MKKINLLIINGPNLNFLGKREPEIYGNTSFDVYMSELKMKYDMIKLDYFQSNIEGELIDKLQEASDNYTGVILNAGGYSHTSIALRDTIKMINVPVIEVHISNTASREDFRKNSYLSAVSRGTITGFGLMSYELAIQAFIIQQ